MKPTWIGFCAIALLLASCESKAGTGALAGGGLGALSGGLITHSATGAVVGGAIGAAAGGLIGYALDEQDRKTMQQNSPNTLQKIDNKEQLDIQDVENMSKNGLSDDVIINQIKSTESVFHLTTDQIIELKNAGVSQKVIDYMIQTGQH